MSAPVEYVALSGADADDKQPTPPPAPGLPAAPQLVHVIQAPLVPRVHRGWKWASLGLLGVLFLGGCVDDYVNGHGPRRGPPERHGGPHDGPPDHPPWRPDGPHGGGRPGPHGRPGRHHHPMPPCRPPKPGYPDYDYDAHDYDGYDYASSGPSDGKPDGPDAPPLVRCHFAAKKLERGCSDAFVAVERGVRRGDIDPSDAADKFKPLAQTCELKLEELVDKCAEAWSNGGDEPPGDEDDNEDDEDTNHVPSPKSNKPSKHCLAAISAMTMPCVDEPGGILQAYKAKELTPEQTAKSLGEAAEQCADASVFAIKKCTEDEAE